MPEPSVTTQTASVHALTKTFAAGAERREILRGLSFSVQAGQALAIMGPSGSGKSTLLNVLGTLEKPDGGRVDLFGTDPFALSDAELARFRNAQVGFVFQQHHLLPQCSVLENVLLPTLVSERADRNKESAPQRAQRLLERVGLKERLHDRPGRLSGGERQRAALVRALINAPRLLLADEPTGSLDHASAENIGQLLIELKCEENVALVVVTHTLELARRMDALSELREGVLVPVEAPAALKGARP